MVRHSLVKYGLATAGYMVLAVAVLVAFLRIEANNREDEARNTKVLAAVCDNIDDNRQTLIDLIDSDQPPLEPPPGSTPALVAVLEEANKRNDEFKADALAKLAKDCRSRVAERTHQPVK